MCVHVQCGDFHPGADISPAPGQTYMDTFHILNPHAMCPVQEAVLVGIHDGQGMAHLELVPVEALIAVQVECHEHGLVVAVLHQAAVAPETVAL